MEAFVNWNLSLERGEVGEFFDNIERIYSTYNFVNGVNNGGEFERVDLLHMSTQMLDALARKEADPNYQLDLTSLQQQRY
jgi:hypothetical protein